MRLRRSSIQFEAAKKFYTILKWGRPTISAKDHIGMSTSSSRPSSIYDYELTLNENTFVEEAEGEIFISQVQYITLSRLIICDKMSIPGSSLICWCSSKRITHTECLEEMVLLDSVCAAAANRFSGCLLGVVLCAQLFTGLLYYSCFLWGLKSIEDRAKVVLLILLSLALSIYNSLLYTNMFPISKATGLDGTIPPAWVGTGIAYAAQDEGDQAMAVFRIAVRLFHGCHLPTLYMGMQYLGMHNSKLAEQILACSSWKKNIYNELGVVAYNMKE
ncbi:hypothetical protein EJB05_15081 [Eragrostis curvula]|uniref:Uncharacterized protein n=1 Tax=Eragrostis curvula TaxID=38414 RepID=A0A5J9W0U9_9POAL|nr:hypothetical protein EJB05_15081 [Eragrostis curvula]